MNKRKRLKLVREKADRQGARLKANETKDDSKEQGSSVRDIPTAFETKRRRH